MPAGDETRPPPPESGWFLREWLLELGRTQAELVEMTDLSKGRVSEFVNGKQRYNRDVVEQIAGALGLEPHQLLMHPDDALALDRLREAARGIVEGQSRAALVRG